MIGWIHFSVPFCISSDSVENAESSPSTLEDRASYEFNLGEALHTSLSDPKELREKPALSDKYRDALFSLSGPAPLNGFDYEFSVKQSHRLHLFEGNRDVGASFQPTRSTLSSFFSCSHSVLIHRF